MEQKYTIEEVGRRARAKNPNAFQGFTDAQVGLTIVKDYPELQKIVQPPKPQPKKQFGYQELGQDIKETGQAIGSRFTSAADKYNEIDAAQASGEQGGWRSLWQKFGTAAGAVSKSIGDIFVGAGKSLMTQKQEDTTARNVEKATGAVINTPIIREGLAEGIARWKKLKKEDPAAARDLEALFDTSMLALDVWGLGALNQGRKAATSQIDDVVRKTLRGIDDILPPGGGSGGSKIKIPKIGSLGTVPVVDKTINEYAKSRLPKLLGIFSGESDDVIVNALRNPKAARIGIEQGDDALRKIVEEGAENSTKMRDAFNQGHRLAKQEVLGEYGKVLIPKNNVKGIFNKLLEEYKVKRDPRTGTLDFTTSKIASNPGEIGKIMKAYSALDQWDSFTLNNLDEYKQFVGSLMKFAKEGGGTSSSATLGRLYNELNEIAYKKLPKDVANQYKIVNDNYSKNIGYYDDVYDAFHSSDPFAKIAGSLGKNKDTLRQTLEFYFRNGGDDVLPVVAGRELGMEKTAAFGFLNPRSWVDFFISPEMQGKIITDVGEKLPGMVDDIIPNTSQITK